MSELANNLKCRMRELNMTQKELGQRVRLSPSMIWRLLTGKVTETRHIVKLAIVLECDPTWLQYGEGLTTFEKDAERRRRVLETKMGLQPSKKRRKLLTEMGSHSLSKAFAALSPEQALIIQSLFDNWSQQPK